MNDFAHETEQRIRAAIIAEIEKRVAGLECTAHGGGPAIVIEQGTDGTPEAIARGSCCPEFDAVVQTAIDGAGPIEIDVLVNFTLE